MVHYNIAQASTGEYTIPLSSTGASVAVLSVPAKNTHTPTTSKAKQHIQPPLPPSSRTNFKLRIRHISSTHRWRTDKQPCISCYHKRPRQLITNTENIMCTCFTHTHLKIDPTKSPASAAASPAQAALLLSSHCSHTRTHTRTHTPPRPFFRASRIVCLAALLSLAYIPCL